MKETVEFSELVGKALDGDNAAFEELYRLTNKTAYSTAYLLLKNQSDVEDVLQNVYLKAFRNLSELKNPDSFESWIKTIVENESKNYIKKEKRIHAPIVFIKNKSTDYSEEWNQPIPQEFMEREELRKSVNEILDKLSPEIRACIVLFHYEDKSLNEISEILDLPLGTVKSRLHNGRKQIERGFGKLRKKDPTLYGIAAIPALLSLLAFQAENIAVPSALSEAVLSAAAGVTAASAGGAVSAGGAAASAASVSAAATGASTATGAAATAVTSIAVKVTAVAVAGSVAVGGGVAVKNHVENKAAETTAAYTSAVIQEETCTVAQTEMTLTEILTTVISESTTELITSKTSTAADKSQTSATSTTVSEKSTTNARQTTTRRTTTKKATTTAKETTTAAVTTTKPTTTREVTTTKPTTTKKETTTVKPATTKPTTTAVPTTNPENNYGASGGVITEYTGSESNVSIPAKIGSDSVTAIGAGAFAGNTNVKSVSLPSSVTQIGQEAFADCSSLSSVSLPSSLELIGIGAFYGCSTLTSVTVPNGTKTIDDEAFAECASLGTVTIPESVTNISDSAFDGCDSLTIRCTEGSQAHNYALANSINYTLI